MSPDQRFTHMILRASRYAKGKHHWIFLCPLTVLLVLGCSSSSNTLVIDAPQPVYFGNTPSLELPKDSVKAFYAVTLHSSEAEKTRGGKDGEITTGGKELQESTILREVHAAFEGTSNRFIGDVVVRARVETCIPWYTILADVIVFLLGGDSESGYGELTSEQIEITGKVYRLGREKR